MNLDATNSLQSGIRLATDTGGTFTDLVVEDGDSARLYKASTTPHDPVIGVLDAIELAAKDYGLSRSEFLGRCTMFVHGTTRAINAILTDSVAKTAFITTRGHRDILLIREGGRSEPFNFQQQFPQPYIPRRYTFEVDERVGPQGEVVRALDEEGCLEVIERLKALKIEAVAVCLLWSVVNAGHELRIGKLLQKHLADVPFTLSHQLNPTLREYRRAASTVIDASLKPLMFTYLNSLTERLREAGFGGHTFVLTSGGGILDAAAVARSPIHSINSGPAMAPVAGRFFAGRDFDNQIAIVADSGGTTFDVSLVRDGKIPWTRETWIGPKFRGHMTGFPSIDIKSIGAGGGSIAWVDGGGVLQVGPQSAGSVPGPVAYGKGGTQPTVTDCALILGYIDPAYFLGGTMVLDSEAARRQVETKVAIPLGVTVEQAAAAVLALTTEKMVGAIEEITVNQGVDPTVAILIGGGGAAGLNAVALARRLKCAGVLIPETGAVLSASGALLSDLTFDAGQVHFTKSDNFSIDTVGTTIAGLKARCDQFIQSSGAGEVEHTVEYSVEARYPHQIWEIEIPLGGPSVRSSSDVESLKDAFHDMHQRIFEICDRGSEVEFVTWRARVSAKIGSPRLPKLVSNLEARSRRSSRKAYFSSIGWVDIPVLNLDRMQPGEIIAGPAIVESSVTTVVVEPETTASRTPNGGLRIDF